MTCPDILTIGPSLNGFPGAGSCGIPGVGSVLGIPGVGSVLGVPWVLFAAWLNRIWCD